MTDREDRIREIAYFLWIEEGYPDGQAERHWQAAETRLDAEDLERKSVEGEPPGDPLDRSSTASSPTRAGAAPASQRRGVPSGKDQDASAGVRGSI